MLRSKPQTGVVTPGTIILNALVRAMKAEGVEHINVNDLERAINKISKK